MVALNVFLGGPLQHLHSHSNSPRVVASLKAIAMSLRNAGFSVWSAHEVEEFGAATPAFEPTDVTERDLGWASACDAYVAVLPVDESNVPYRSDGTHVELGWATALGKAVVLILEDAPAKPYSHLVLGLLETGRARRVPLDRWDVELELAVSEAVAGRSTLDKTGFSRVT